MKKSHRIFASCGLVLIIASIALLLAGCFVEAYRALLMNISLITFACAAAVLVFLKVARNRDEEVQKDSGQDEA